MQLKEVKFDPKWIAGPSEDMDTPRSSGLHLSQIYGDLDNTVTPRDEMDAGTLDTFRCGGFLWERILEVAFSQSIGRPGGIVRPGELYVDGVIGSPDNVQVDREPWRVVETKCTWKSVRKWDSLERNFWVWLVQIKGYCRMVGTTEAWLIALFINGDYRGSGPIIKSAELKFSQHEIEENWNMLLNHARKRGWL